MPRRVGASGTPSAASVPARRSRGRAIASGAAPKRPVLQPNPDTIAAMAAAERGETVKVGRSLSALFESLNDEDDARGA